MTPEQSGTLRTALITKLIIVVATSLVVVTAAFAGLVALREKMPSAQQRGDVTRADVAAPDPTSESGSATQPPSPAQTPSTAAASWQFVDLANEADDVAASQKAKATSAAPPISTASLFTGAIRAAGAASRPSTGGVQLAATGRGALAGKVIVVDAGHNGRSSASINNRQVPDGAGRRKACNTTGTATDSGYTEHAHNWAVATRLAAVLKARGATVVLTRPDDAGAGPCVDQRAAIGNASRANLVLSIHADGAAPTARGFHVIRSTRMAGGAAITAASARAATIVRDAFAAGTGRPRSTYLGANTAMTPRGDIAGLNLSRVPAVMLEAGNMRNPAEAKLLRSSAFQDREAYALAAAAHTFLTR